MSTPAAAKANSQVPRLREETQPKNQIRACLFNLIIFSDDPRRSAYLHQIVQSIIEKFPCRIIFIQSVHDAPEPFVGPIAGTALVNMGDTVVICDRFNIDAAADQLHRVPSIVLPLLVPDLPVYLVWGQNPTTEAVILPQLKRFASRLIFDTECTDNLPDFCAKVIKLLDAAQMEIRDVKWAALGGWREVLARTFDTPEKIKELKECRNIQIIYNNRPSVFVSHTDISPIYLQAWLASRLEWRYQSTEKQTEGHCFMYKNGKHSIKAELIPQDIEELESGAISTVRVMTEDGISFLIDRKKNQPQAIVHIETKEKCEMPIVLPLSELKNTVAFLEEIFYRKTSDHYRSMLEMIVNYEGLDECK